MDTLQVMEERSVRQAKIVEALEAEKKKLGKDLEELQTRRALRENRTPKAGEWSLPSPSYYRPLHSEVMSRWLAWFTVVVWWSY